MIIKSPICRLAAVASLLTFVAAEVSLQFDDELFADPNMSPNVLQNDQFVFGLDPDGKLFIEGDFSKTVIADADTLNAVFKMQGDGNAVLYNLDDGITVVWASNTQGNHGAKLYLDDSEGVAKIISIDGKILRTYRQEGCKGVQLQQDQTLSKGEFLCYNGVRFGLNDVGEWIYESFGTIEKFGSLDAGSDGDIRMQVDGNLVLYDVGENIVAECSTQTAGNPVTALYLTDTSEPEIIDSGGTSIWSLGLDSPISCRT